MVWSWWCKNVQRYFFHTLWILFLYQCFLWFLPHITSVRKKYTVCSFQRKTTAILFLDLKCNSTAILPTVPRVSWSPSLAWQGLDPTSIPGLFPSTHLSCAHSFMSYYSIPRESLQCLSMNRASPTEMCPVESGLAGTLPLLRVAILPGRGGSRICHQVEPGSPEMGSLPLCTSPTESTKQGTWHTHHLTWNELLF